MNTAQGGSSCGVEDFRIQDVLNIARREKNMMDEHDAVILVVEDSPTQALQLELLLGGKGYDVAVTHNGREALAFLKKNTASIVISDVIMPEMDGYELSRQIKADAHLRHIPILLLTTLSDPEDMLKALESGADNFVLKPYEDKSLLSRIKHILDNRKTRSNAESRIGIEVSFSGKELFINSDRIQILDLMFSMYDRIINQYRELERVSKDLNDAKEAIKNLHGILPICANCKRIRDDNDQWQNLEKYIEAHSRAAFSHGLCDKCCKELYPDMYEEIHGGEE